MRKHNEGYVLIYVLVVMVVMGLVATGVLTVSLNNYRAQQAAGQRMQELYEAEGIAEQLVAELRACSSGATVLTPAEIDSIRDSLGEGESDSGPAWEHKLSNALLSKTFSVYEDVLQEIQNRWNVEPDAMTIAICEDEEGQIIYDSQMNPSYEIIVVIQQTNTKIDASLLLTVKRNWIDGEAVESDTLDISTKTVTYESYEISTGVGA